MCAYGLRIHIIFWLEIVALRLLALDIRRKLQVRSTMYWSLSAILQARSYMTAAFPQLYLQRGTTVNLAAVLRAPVHYKDKLFLRLRVPLQD